MGDGGFVSREVRKVREGLGCFEPRNTKYAKNSGRGWLSFSRSIEDDDDDEDDNESIESQSSVAGKNDMLSGAAIQKSVFALCLLERLEEKYFEVFWRRRPLKR